LDGIDHGHVNTGNFYFDVAIFCSLLALSFYVWTSASGINRKDEVSAGAVALAVMVGWYAVLALFLWTLPSEISQDFNQWALVTALSLVPGGIMVLISQAGQFTSQQIVFGISCACTVHLLLVAFWQASRGSSALRRLSLP
jgi:hypothetical protein